MSARDQNLRKFKGFLGFCADAPTLSNGRGVLMGECNRDLPES